MADEGTGVELGEATETSALREALAAEHAAVWGYGVVGAALPEEQQEPATAAAIAHREVRDRVMAVLAERDADPVPAAGAYDLPFPVLSAVDAAALAVTLEEGVSRAWVRVLDQAAERPVRELAVGWLTGAEVRAVAWRAAAGTAEITRAFPGLPE